MWGAVVLLRAGSRGSAVTRNVLAPLSTISTLPRRWRLPASRRRNVHTRGHTHTRARTHTRVCAHAPDPRPRLPRCRGRGPLPPSRLGHLLPAARPRLYALPKISSDRRSAFLAFVQGDEVTPGHSISTDRHRESRAEDSLPGKPSGRSQRLPPARQRLSSTAFIIARLSPEHTATLLKAPSPRLL